MGTARFVGEEEEQLSWPDQAEFPSRDLLDCPGILSKSVRRPSEYLVLEAEPADIVGEYTVSLLRLERVDQAVLADQRVGDKHGCTKYQGEVHQAADPDGRVCKERGVLTLEAYLATWHARSEVSGSGRRLGYTVHRGATRWPTTVFGTRGGND